MKILPIYNNIYNTQIRQLSTGSKTNFKGNDNYNDVEILSLQTGEKGSYGTANIRIYEKDYRFATHACGPEELEESIESDTQQSLGRMIDNIKQTQVGRFVRVKNNEYFIPRILKNERQLRRNELAIKYGTTKTIENFGTDIAINTLHKFLNKDITVEDITTINYLHKPLMGYANNTVRTAYGYYDKINDYLYLYIPEKNKLQIQNSNGYIDVVKLYENNEM